MEPATLISLFFVLLASCITIGIGVSNIKSKHPVGFYSGEPHPDDEDITDMKAYNRKHGLMWILYGVGIAAVFCLGFLPINRYVYLFLIFLEMIGGVILMILNHNKLNKRYRR